MERVNWHERNVRTKVIKAELVRCLMRGRQARDIEMHTRKRER